MSVEYVRNMTHKWRTESFADVADGTDYAFTAINNPGFGAVIGINPGESIIRTRVQGQIVVGQKDIHPTTYIPGEYVLGANSMQVGVYYAGPLGVNWPPPNVGQTPSDGGWLMRAQCQLVDMSAFLDVNSLEYCWGVYNLPSACIDSEASRKPATNASMVGLTWTFFNPLVEFWRENTADVLGLISMAFTVNLLVNVP
jgi:hypothetical protein